MSSRKKLYSNESYYLLKYSVWALVVCPQFLLTLLNAHLKLTSVYFELYILNYVAGVSLSWPPYCLQTCSPTSVHKLKKHRIMYTQLPLKCGPYNHISLFYDYKLLP